MEGDVAKARVYKKRSNIEYTIINIQFRTSSDAVTCRPSWQTFWTHIYSTSQTPRGNAPIGKSIVRNGMEGDVAKARVYKKRSNIE